LLVFQIFAHFPARLI